MIEKLKNSFMFLEINSAWQGLIDSIGIFLFIGTVEYKF